jgi:hypothetical protein
MSNYSNKELQLNKKMKILEEKLDITIEDYKISNKDFQNKIKLLKNEINFKNKKINELIENLDDNQSKKNFGEIIVPVLSGISCQVRDDILKQKENVYDPLIEYKLVNNELCNFLNIIYTNIILD